MISYHRDPCCACTSPMFIRRGGYILLRQFIDVNSLEDVIVVTCVILYVMIRLTGLHGFSCGSNAECFPC